MASLVAEVREFNRFYTATIGVLRDGLLRTPYSLTEARVIFELAQHDETEVAGLRRRLGVDAGYLSRILARFAADGLVARTRSAVDGRRQVIRLTPAGRKAYRLLGHFPAQATTHFFNFTLGAQLGFGSYALGEPARFFQDTPLLTFCGFQRLGA